MVMTDEKALMSQIHTLPESLKAEVARFVEKLKRQTGEKEAEKPRRRKAGSMAGKIVILPGFDDPLEEFEEYM
jgi:Protein of unknown function (DUF2281).